MTTSETSTKPKVSKQFIIEITRVTFALLLFVVVYILLFALGLGAALALTGLGLFLIFAKPMFITLLLGGGLSLTGLMTFFFLIKFIFHRKEKSKVTDFIVNPTDYQALHAFINQLAEQVGTRPPKKIVLFPGVNASVYFDSDFLSMFWPVQKNLSIGMGLINSVNYSEFRAIIAHELGHFSQKSMLIGSFVNNFNKIIYNLLYENEGYNNVLEKFGNTHPFITMFANLTSHIIKFIQWLLQKMYNILNKTNLSLSREMEYHADAIAAWVAGSGNLISGLQRIEIGDFCFEQMTGYLNNMINENKKHENIYPVLSEFVKDYALSNNYSLRNNLPEINKKRIENRISIKNPWASHPTLPNREKYLSNRAFPEFEKNEKFPWELFPYPENIQIQLTNVLYQSVEFIDIPEMISFEEFKDEYYTEKMSRSFHPDYMGYYDYRQIILNNENSGDDVYQITLQIPLSDEITELPLRLSILNNDITNLHYLKHPENKIKYFDFDGLSMSVIKVDEVLTVLQKDADLLVSQITATDNSIFRFALNKVSEIEAVQLKNLYELYHEITIIAGEFRNYLAEFNAILSPIYSDGLKVDQAKTIIRNAQTVEKNIKNIISNHSEKFLLPEIVSPEDKQDIDKYINENQSYFNLNSFDNEELGLMNKCQTLFANLLFSEEFNSKKAFLDKQHEFIKIEKSN